MTIVTREQIAPCVLPEETVLAPSVGGDVLVRGMDITQVMRFKSQLRAIGKPRKGEDQATADERSGAEMLPILLSMTVLAADGDPVYSAAQWSAFAIKHMGEAMQIAEVSMRLSGLEREPGKP